MNKKIALHTLGAFFCAMCGILACAAQSSFLPHFFNDSYFVLDILLCLTVALGVCGGSAYGAFFGIFAGILADSTTGFGISLLPLFYMLCGYAVSIVAELIPNKNFLIYLATGAICALLRSLVSVIYVMLSSGTLPIFDVARYVCIPIILGTCFALPFIYPLGLLLTLPARKSKKSMDNIM